MGFNGLKTAALLGLMTGLLVLIGGAIGGQGGMVLAFGFAIIIVMIFRPQGLLPSKRRKAELLGHTEDAQLYDVSKAGA